MFEIVAVTFYCATIFRGWTEPCGNATILGGALIVQSKAGSIESMESDRSLRSDHLAF